ncbi:MAG: hypothetical protein JXJ18_06680 [Rhodobacteraceae bacterium]|nr:hypothetical protein [Paracoccaceae bacterium]
MWRFAAILGVMLCLWPSVAAADVPMAPFIGWGRIGHAWVVLLAIGIEAAALKWLFAVSWRRATVLSLVVNLVTAALGVVVYPFIGLALYPMFAPLVMELSHGGFLVEAGVALAIVALVDWGIELGVLALVFGLDIRRARAAGFLVANVLSAALLFGALWYEQYIPGLGRNEWNRIEADHGPEIAFLREVLEEMPAHAYYGYPWLDRDWRDEVAARAEGLRFYDLGFGIRVSETRYHDMFLNDLTSAGWTVDAQEKRGAVTLQRRERGTFTRPVFTYRIERDVPGAPDTPQWGAPPVSVSVIGAFRAP